MNKLRTATATALLLAFSALATAETVNIGGASAASNDGRPSRGMTQTSVQSKYGSPVSVVAPVGEPPITRWEYSNFVVFFEYDKVIHTVLKH